MADTKAPPERRVVLPVDPSRRTEIDKQRVPMSARPYRLLAMVKQMKHYALAYKLKNAS